MRKKIKLKVLLAAIIFIFTACASVEFPALSVKAADDDCSAFFGDNTVNEVNISAPPIESHLYQKSDGTFLKIRVSESEIKGDIFSEWEVDEGENIVLAETYDESFNYIGSKRIPLELDIYGGFYYDGTYYYVLSASDNHNEDDNKEVFRLTQYDKMWNKISHGSIYGADTYEPFRAGGARFTDCDGQIVVHTCHLMYTSSDGLNHQSNITLYFNKNDISDCTYNNTFYTSHSFNQFIISENDRLVALDHGDAYPRSVWIQLKRKGFNRNKSVEVIEIPGEIGDNYTGTYVSGFNQSDTAYIVLGNKVDYDKMGSSDNRNIYIAAVQKNDDGSFGNVNLKTITSYNKEFDYINSKLVKLPDDTFIALWNLDSTVYAQKLDSNGNLLGGVNSFKGTLSDCEPIVAGNRIVWFFDDVNIIKFYSVDIDSLDGSLIKSVNRGHVYRDIVATGKQKNASKECIKCGHKTTFPVPNECDYWWGKNGTGNYESEPESHYEVGEEFLCWLCSDESLGNMAEAIVSDSSKISVLPSEYGSDNVLFKTLKPGKVKVTVRLKYRPAVSKTITIKIGHEYHHKKTLKKRTFYKGGKEIRKCDKCSKTKTVATKPLTPEFNYIFSGKKYLMIGPQVKKEKNFQIKLTRNKKSKVNTYKVNKKFKKLGYVELIGIKSGKYKIKFRVFKTVNGKRIYSKWSSEEKVKVK